MPLFKGQVSLQKFPLLLLSMLNTPLKNNLN